MTTKNVVEFYPGLSDIITSVRHWE